MRHDSVILLDVFEKMIEFRIRLHSTYEMPIASDIIRTRLDNSIILFIFRESFSVFKSKHEVRTCLESRHDVFNVER